MLSAAVAASLAAQPPEPAAPVPAEPAVTSAPAAPAPAAEPAPAPATTPPPAKPGEIVVSGERKLQKIDPLMGVNKTSYQVMQKVDDTVVAPVAHVYRDDLPKPVREGIHNFFYNLTEPVNAINHLLQLHPGRAFQTVARFGINSTLGIGGLMDVAKKKPFHLRYRFNGFANTLGYYGIGPGPYFFLPLVGPTTLRDLIGTLLNQAALPTLVGGPFKNKIYVTSAGVITSLDYRVVIDDDLKQVRQTSSPYSTYRQIYLKARFEEIEALHGRGPLAKGQIGEGAFAKPIDADTPPPPAAAPVPAPEPVVGPPHPPEPPLGPPVPPPPVFVSHPVVQPLPAGAH